jgi:hypothetical protein
MSEMGWNDLRIVDPPWKPALGQYTSRKCEDIEEIRG